MSLVILTQLLKDAIGLDATSIGASAVERAVEERQRACNLARVDSYTEHVQRSGTELQHLIEAVVVPETWFFRDGEPFAALARVAAHEWLRAGQEGVYRLLSVPCATGEEPYSMAMVLLETGFAPSRFRVDAVDISERVLSVARRAIYGRISFRGTDRTLRDRFFQPVIEGHQLADVVRQQVAFHRGNLLAPAFVAAGRTYDVIFCRNLLIYFDAPTQQRAIATLVKLLAPGGYLFVGASETGALLNQGLESAKLPMAFAFRKAREAGRVSTPPPIAVAVRAEHRPIPKPASVVPVRARPIGHPVARHDLIADAQRFADEGRFVEATMACEAHLRAQGPSASAFYLLGLVGDATGNRVDAEAHYRKALYLDPNHSEALAHLALLMDAQGREADALIFRNRVRRLELTSKS